MVNELRGSVLKSLSDMGGYCRTHGGEISGGWQQNYGYIVETEHYRYCLRCNPQPGDYQVYLTCFDLRVQRMNMANAAPVIARTSCANGEDYGLTEQGRQALRDTAAPGKPPATAGSWGRISPAMMRCGMTRNPSPGQSTVSTASAVPKSACASPRTRSPPSIWRLATTAKPIWMRAGGTTPDSQQTPPWKKPPSA